MQDLLNPGKWMGFLNFFKSGNVGEILILLILIVFIFLYFIYQYIKMNNM